MKTIRYDQPFEIKPFKTEWGDWGDPVPFINKKFGSRPEIVCLYPPYRCDWNNEILEKTVRNNSVLYLRYGADNHQLKKLLETCASTNQPRLIVTIDKIRSIVPTPSNVRILHTSGMAYQFSKVFDDSNLKPKFKRQVTELTHPFMLMASNPDSDRVKVLMMLKALNIPNMLYSSGNVKAKDLQYKIDNIVVNKHQKDLHEKYLGNKYLKFFTKENFNILPKLLEKCHFHVAMDSNVLDENYTHFCVAEKHLQGFTSTTPIIPIWNKAEAQQMKEWGFKFNNIPSRGEFESKQEAVLRWCKEILFYYQITKNNDWSQSWQDKQGEDTYHNFKLLKELHHKISNDIEQQIEELPQEFKKL